MPISSAGAAVGTAVLGPGVGTAVGGVAGSFFHSSSAGPNKDAAAACWPEVQRGNLAAVQAFLNRATIQTAVAAQPWKDGVAQMKSAPNWLDIDRARQAALAAKKFPESWWQLAPEQVFPAVQQNAFVVSAVSGAGTGTGASAAAPQTEAPALNLTASQTVGHLPLWALVAIFAGGAYVLFRFAKKG